MIKNLPDSDLDDSLTSESIVLSLLSTDVDGTLIGKHDATERFNRTWKSIPTESRPLLCYNTGRLLDDTLDLIETQGLIRPDYLTCGVGTLIYNVNADKVMKNFDEVLEDAWDLSVVESIARAIPGIRKQPEKFQSKYKSSWYLNGADADTIESFDQSLSSAGLNANIVYSSDRDLDIIPKYANKGNALVWLLQRLDIPRSQVLVAGDTGNDAAMFLKRGIRGIIVGNAQPELLEATAGLNVYRAEGSCADGLLEGLMAYKVIDKVEQDISEPADVPENPSISPNLRAIIKDEQIRRLTDEERDYLETARLKAIEGLKRNITPMGFSACSLEDNLSEGTDANYRSVWARDGSITVIGCLDLEDPLIRHCQTNTLETLLEHTSLNGQVPSNVSIDNGKADYSGIGGICSIDSGIWLVIACSEYIRKRGDIDFLRRHRPTLQKIMDWLSAHDSNNDGLLEIPEAGDWTDLFGRSYNVLYDEALWYKANICFGRMMEMLGESRMAGDYFRWSGIIKSSIIDKFWPSLHKRAAGHYSFADNQTSLGDTQYLIAQVTPFDFDWRCDVYGNILAFLFDALDIELASKAFHYMWGVGVNDPHPVANLYPAVQSGDPSWRDYYTVNLLNLPHHYHNGGIWPFIGGQWVRFINKLGLRDVALRELIRLAKLNETGIKEEWEFNEWAHGVTGKPMGKRYQAWSCSEFIKACKELRI